MDTPQQRHTLTPVAMGVRIALMRMSRGSHDLSGNAIPHRQARKRMGQVPCKEGPASLSAAGARR